jgi:hypothetical protein
MVLDYYFGMPCDAQHTLPTETLPETNPTQRLSERSSGSRKRSAELRMKVLVSHATCARINYEEPYISRWVRGCLESGYFRKMQELYFRILLGMISSKRTSSLEMHSAIGYEVFHFRQIAIQN